MIIRKLIVFISTCFLIANVSFAFPVLTGRVVDEAGIFSPQTESQLTQLLKSELEHQVVVVSLASLDGKSIEEYGVELGRYWQIGDDQKDNGVVLLIAPKERLVRIEVGYGLEGTLTDAISKTIIHQGMRPYLEKGDFNRAALIGAEAVLKVIKSGKRIDQEVTESPSAIQLILIVLIVGLFLYVGLAPQQDRARRLRLVLFWLSFVPGKHGGGGFKGKGGSFGGGGASEGF